MTGNSGSGLFGKKYTWNRIESAAEFVSKEDLTDEAKNNLKQKQWVLRFAETPYKYTETLPTAFKPGSFRREYTEISDVTILRLKFETEGVIYNLGAVDNKQTGNEILNKPNGFNFWAYIWNCLVKLFTGKANAWETFVAVATIIVAVAALVLVIKFLRWVITGIFGKGK